MRYPADTDTRVRAHTRLVRVTLIAVLIVIGLGAYTRLTDAGLGCPDWPGCYGHLLLPTGSEALERANARWSEFPVDIARATVEMTHRVAAGVLGVLILLLACWSLRLRRQGVSWILAWVAVGLVVLQALFGMWTVTLKLLPQIVSAHLLGGFSLLVVLYWYYLRSPGLFPGTVAKHTHRHRRWVLVGAVLVVIQIALGGWLSANYAAVACPDFPTCQGRWLPPTDFSRAFNLAQTIGPNYLGGLLDNSARVTIHFTHRVGAVLLSVYLLGVSLLLLCTRSPKHLLLSVCGMLGVLLLQVLLGIANVVFSFPVALAVAHNIVAALLLLSVVRLVYLSYGQSA